MPAIIVLTMDGCSGPRCLEADDGRANLRHEDDEGKTTFIVRVMILEWVFIIRLTEAALYLHRIADETTRTLREPSDEDRVIFIVQMTMMTFLHRKVDGTGVY